MVNYMGLFEELFDAIDKGGEELLDNFLASNPELQHQVNLDEIRDAIEQDNAAIRDLKSQKDQYYERVLSLADEIIEWQGRQRLAQSKGRQDLADGAAGEIAKLYVKGRQVWQFHSRCEKKIEELSAAVAEKRAKLKALNEKKSDSGCSDSSFGSSGSNDLNDAFNKFEEELKSKERGVGL
jgi:phage shock protein A